MLRLTWPLETCFWRSAFNQKKYQKCSRIACGVLCGVSRALIKDRAGGRRRRQRQAGGRARRGPEPCAFFFPASSCLHVSSFFPFDAMNDFPEHYQLSWHAECCVSFLFVCVYDSECGGLFLASFWAVFGLFCGCFWAVFGLFCCAEARLCCPCLQVV